MSRVELDLTTRGLHIRLGRYVDEHRMHRFHALMAEIQRWHHQYLHRFLLMIASLPSLQRLHLNDSFQGFRPLRGRWVSPCPFTILCSNLKDLDFAKFGPLRVENVMPMLSSLSTGPSRLGCLDISACRKGPCPIAKMNIFRAVGDILSTNTSLWKLVLPMVTDIQGGAASSGASS